MNENPYYNDADKSAIQKEPKSGLSTGAFVLSIISILTCLFLINIPFAIVSIIFALIVIIKKYGKRKLSIASLIISSLSIVISVIVIILSMPMLKLMPDLTEDIKILFKDENYKEIIEEYDKTGKLPENFEKYSDGEAGELFDKYYGGFDKFFDKSIRKYFD